MSMFSTPWKGARILVVQHSEEAPGGNFCKGLLERGARLTLVNPTDGGALPGGPEEYDGLVALGGPQHAYDDVDSPHFPHLMDLMRRFDAEKKPVAGLCLGCQLLARAHGATVYTMPHLEFGYVRHALTEEGTMDSLVAGLELPALMEFHEDTFDLPAEASLLIRGERCANQCFKVGNASYGFQFHIEADRAVVMRWIGLFRNGNGALATYGRHADQFDDAFFEGLTAGLPAYIEAAERFCDRVSGRWLALACR